ncbi:hypothetical protein CAPTEDRAFT_210453 [Capitella teleta]|uniref:ethanolamine kinase n=1 Tax=Capitella teleta TaxID=283909 RepID=R7V3S5_CAPTE|nr:hypothetical protein CAPTEDRAFT_210453 [Capitella teleta]|eukprot:ELU13508.1 hypothetical protein CAPTEDRAFT_210453 [Capitella teleta]
MAAIPGPIYSDAHIPRDSMVAGARALMRTIRPQWSSADVTVKVFTDGTSNQLVGCCNQQCPEAGMVLVRVYGPNTELLIDRDAELVVMTLLHAAGCGPALLAKFTNGVAYDFVPGHCPTLEEIRTEKYGSLTARAMAKIHLIKPAEFLPPTLTINQEPDLFQNLHKCLDLLPENFDDQGKNQKLQELKKAYDFADEVELLEKELLPLQSPVVLCHNDAAANNIIYKPGEDEICFIDYEYSSFNYSAYDIANHFCEYCGCLLQASHLYWGMWALIQAKHSIIEYDFIGYAEERFGEYFKRKGEFLKLQ